MRKRAFIGKSVSLEELRNIDADLYPVGEYDDHYAMAEIFLKNFDCDAFTDRTGRNAYSIQLYLDKERIVEIERIGHCHMKGGQGSDDVLSRFPHQTLEEEAQDILTELLE